MQTGAAEHTSDTISPNNSHAASHVTTRHDSVATLSPPSAAETVLGEGDTSLTDTYLPQVQGLAVAVVWLRRVGGAGGC